MELKMGKLLLDDYDDEYDTCSSTYATLRIYPNEIHPNEITQILGVEPSEFQVKGEKSPSPVLPIFPINGWFLTSEKQVKSRDVRRHIDYVIGKVIGKKNEILSLQDKDVEMDLSCLWSSTQGQGGPTLSPKQMKALAELNIDIWFDIY